MPLVPTFKAETTENADSWTNVPHLKKRNKCCDIHANATPLPQDTSSPPRMMKKSNVRDLFKLVIPLLKGT